MSELTPNESRYARDLYPLHNVVVAGWMADHGWPVTKAPPSIAGEVFAWMHESGEMTFALRITRDALDYLTPEELGATLDRLQVGKALRRAPKGAVTLHVKDGSPRLSVAT